MKRPLFAAVIVLLSVGHSWAADLPSCKEVAQQRAHFKTQFEKGEYKVAYDALSAVVEPFGTDHLADGEHCIEQRMHAYVELSNAALKMENAIACFEYAEPWFEVVNQNPGLQENDEIPDILANYDRCLELEGGAQIAEEVYCNTLRSDSCFEFRHNMVSAAVRELPPKENPEQLAQLQRESGRLLKAGEFSPQEGGGNLSLKEFGLPGYLTLHQPQSMRDGVDYQSEAWFDAVTNSAPRLVWVDGERVQVLVEDPNICAFSMADMSFEKSGDDLLVIYSGNVRDCYGGTGSVDVTENFIFDGKKLTLKGYSRANYGIH